MEPIYIVFVTAPRDKAEEIGRVLVEERLCACVNIVPEIQSFYWWQGKLEKDGEALLILKTPCQKWEELQAKICEIHPYTVPEILALPVAKGYGDYVNWVLKECQKET